MKPSKFIGIVIRVRRKQRESESYPQLVKHHLIPNVHNITDLSEELQPKALMERYPISEHEISYDKLTTVTFR